MWKQMNAVRMMVLLVCLVCSLEIYASEPEPAQINFYFSVGRLTLDDNQTSAEGVKSDTTFVRLGVERKEGQWLYGGGLSGFLYSDRREFSVLTETVIGGDVQRSSSSASATNVYFEGGYVQKYANNVSLSLLGGLEIVVSSSRSIDNCSDCPSEDIDIDSGAYLSPRIAYPITGRVSLSGSFYQYLSGDAENGFSITLSVVTN